MLSFSKKIVYSALIITFSIALVSCKDEKFEENIVWKKNDYTNPALTPRLLQSLVEKKEISSGDRVSVFGFLQIKDSIAYLYEYKDLSQLDRRNNDFSLMLESYVNNGISSPADSDRKYSSVSGEASLSLGIFSIKNIIAITCYEPR
ncbi:MAG: hypothetical protein ACWA5R_13940 [bacterium]